mmetsp:Transcript_49490/g.72610  ORF Transcript_49490/g.72610 Transcript_49490/m.72610 type:complete len:98 (-) Transcript_49490:660-953(-)
MPVSSISMPNNAMSKQLGSFAPQMQQPQQALGGSLSMAQNQKMWWMQYEQDQLLPGPQIPYSFGESCSNISDGQNVPENLCVFLKLPVGTQWGPGNM